MTEGKKYIVLAPEVYEMLLIKAETPVNPIASTLKQPKNISKLPGNVLEFLKKKRFDCIRKELNKLRRAKDGRNATAYLVQKPSADKVKEEKMNFETIFTQSLPVTLGSRGQLVLNYLKQHSNIISWNEQGQMIYKDDVIENSNTIDLLTWMIKLKPNNTNQISPFVSSLFAKAITECNVPLGWTKNKDMLTMVKMVQESDEELMQVTSITSNILLKKPESEIKWEEFKPYKRSKKTEK